MSYNFTSGVLTFEAGDNFVLRILIENFSIEIVENVAPCAGAWIGACYTFLIIINRVFYR